MKVVRHRHNWQLEETGTLPELEKARALQQKLQDGRERVLNIYQKGYIDAGELDLKMKMIDEHLEAVTEDVERLEAQAGDMQGAIARLSNFLESYAHLIERLDTMTYAERTQLVKMLVSKVVVRGEELEVRMATEPTQVIASRAAR